MHEVATDVFWVRLNCLKEMLFFKLTFSHIEITPKKLTLPLTGEVQS